EDIASSSVADPTAVSVLDRVLRSGADAPVETALELESLAYSTLLASAEFRAWRARVPRADRPSPSGSVQVARCDDVLTVTLDRPDRHNAFDRAMRDGLVDALRLVRSDASIRRVDLSGAGSSFCSGGDLAEFGTADDPALAHLVRLERSAGHTVHLLRDRVRPRLHGACIGAGIEIPAFADHIGARPGTWFKLPEISMGLIPGAGGTVSVPRRIGRWRTAYMALTGRPIDVTTALLWGLVDEQD
ncbi:MAG: enoyl-CoA hydratase/isomerase family protein, partial [Aeromicrobium sp.]